MQRMLRYYNWSASMEPEVAETGVPGIRRQEALLTIAAPSPQTSPTMNSSNGKSVHSHWPANPAACINRLSRKRQEIMRPVFENPREYVLLSTRRLAQKLKVDSGTVVRIAVGMGFSGYPDLQHYLHELALSQATALEPMEASGKIES